MPTRKATPAFVAALGSALRAERERLELSQEELADKAGLDRTYLSGVERGDRCPNLRSLLKLTAAMKLKMSRLMLAAEGKLSDAG